MSENFFGLERAALADLLRSVPGVDNPGARSAHLFRQLYRFGDSLNPLAGISRRFLPVLAQHVELAVPARVHTQSVSSLDGTVKLALQLVDGALIETVLVPERGRLTLCVSSQVGCRQACTFCQTGRMGFRRNLSVAEILAQIVIAERERRFHSEWSAVGVSAYPRIANVVFMGMGEPLDNFAAVKSAVKILIDNQGLNLSPNKVTVSTIGILPQLERLLSETKVAIAFSLHSPFADERSTLIPANRRYPLEHIVAILREASVGAGREFMVQYLLVKGSNDTPAHADALTQLLLGCRVKINLIPLNEIDEISLRRPDLGRVYAFQQDLKSRGLVATVRLSKGRDIEAACGQLVQRQ